MESNDLFLYIQNLLEIVSKSAVECRGAILNFSSKEFLIILNGQTRCVEHQKMATACATLIRQRLKVSKECGSLRIFPKMIVCSGDAKVGNIGNSRMMLFCASGSVFEAVKQIRRQWKDSLDDSHILCNEETSSAIKFHFYLMQVGESGVFVVAQSNSLQNNQEKANEWLYELQSVEDRDIFVKYNEAYRLFLEKDFSKSLVILEEYFTKQIVRLQDFLNPGFKLHYRRLKQIHCN